MVGKPWAARELEYRTAETQLFFGFGKSMASLLSMSRSTMDMRADWWMTGLMSAWAEVSPSKVDVANPVLVKGVAGYHQRRLNQKHNNAFTRFIFACFLYTMARVFLLASAILTTCCYGFDFQLPLQIPEKASLSEPLGKPLVNTTKLQASIHTGRLLARAWELYEIAKLSEDEYNHPTRVIGSAGLFTLL